VNVRSLHVVTLPLESSLSFNTAEL